jgi:hypothetical protein
MAIIYDGLASSGGRLAGLIIVVRITIVSGISGLLALTVLLALAARLFAILTSFAL